MSVWIHPHPWALATVKGEDTIRTYQKYLRIYCICTQHDSEDTPDTAIRACEHCCGTNRDVIPWKDLGITSK